MKKAGLGFCMAVSDSSQSKRDKMVISASIEKRYFFIENRK